MGDDFRIEGRALVWGEHRFSPDREALLHSGLLTSLSDLKHLLQICKYENDQNGPNVMQHLRPGELNKLFKN